MAGNDIGPRIGINGESEFRSSLNAINAQMKSLAAEMKAVTAEFAANADSEEALTAKNNVLGRSVEAARSKLATLDGQLNRQRNKLTELGDALDRAAAEFGKNSKQAAAAQNAYNDQYAAVAKLEWKYNAARAQLAGFENAMAGVGEAAEEASQVLSSQDVLAGTAGWDLIKTAVARVTDAIQEAIQVGMEFDASISDLAATMGVTVGDLGELREFAKDMGATTAFTASQAAEGLNYLALAGKNIEESMEMLPQTLDLAAAGGLALATSTDMVTDAQSALGLTTEQTTALIDQMALTSTKANQDIGQFGAGILEVGGTAKVLAGGTAELNQVLGVLADNSIKGAEGGTKLRNIILSLSAPTEAAAKELDNLGVAVFDAEGNMREFSDIFPEMQKALSKLTSQQQIEALSKIFNSRDIAAAQALLGTTTERWDELAVAIDGAAGSAQQMAETRLDNLAGDITLLQSAADGAKIALADSLNPALRDLTQLGTGVVSVLGNAMEATPFLGQAVVGLTAGLGTLAVGMTAATIATTGLGTALTTAAAAAVASPWGIAALAVGGLVTAFTALSHAAHEADNATSELAESVQAGQDAFTGQKEAAEKQRADTEALIDQLEELAGKESRTAAEKEQLAAITERLNQAVPQLGLSYDSLTDSLSMTTEQIRELAIAQAEAQVRQETASEIVRLQLEQKQITDELTDARENLKNATDALNQAEAEGAAQGLGGDYLAGAYENVNQAAAAVNELEAALNSNQEALDQASKDLDALSDSGDSAADSLEETADAAEKTEESFEELSAYLSGLEEATLYAAGAADTLSDALKEQEKSGSLSVATAQELINAGYGAAIAIDEETGAVTVNAEEYRNLAEKKLDLTIAAAQVELWSEKNHLRMLTEKKGVDDLAASYRGLTLEKLTEQTAGNVTALEAQIAALNRAKTSLSSYGSASEGAARRSSGASKKIKTQAEKDLAEYKTLKAELDHDKNMGLASEEDYYRRLAELRDTYLTDQGNIDEYRKVSETIYKADEKALQEREKLWQSAGDNILKLEEDFQKQLESLASEIVNSYKLFDEVPEYQKKSGTELMANLEDQIASIESFYDNIAALEERGVNAALVKDIRKMGVSASGELAGLLELTDDQLGKYAELYQEKQELANRIAMDELESLRDQTNAEILDQLADVADLYDTNAPALGLAFANSLAKGMFEGMPAVESMAQSVSNAAMSAFERTYNRDVEAMITQPKQRVTSGDIGELLAGAVNGINAGGGTAAYPVVDVTLKIDQQVLAREQVDPMRQAFRERPETMDDT